MFLWTHTGVGREVGGTVGDFVGGFVGDFVGDFVGSLVPHLSPVVDMASSMLWTPPRYVADPMIALETWEGVNPG